MKAAAVVLVVAHHHQDRDLHRHRQAQMHEGALGALARVARHHDHLDIRKDDDLPRRPDIGMEVAEYLDPHKALRRLAAALVARTRRRK